MLGAAGGDTCRCSDAHSVCDPRHLDVVCRYNIDGTEREVSPFESIPGSFYWARHHDTT